MGSHFKASIVNMKIFLLAFTLAMHSFQGGTAKKLSCLQCESMVGAESAECAEGTAKGKECPGIADGCIVIAGSGEFAGQSATTWTRACCVGNETALGSCSEFHQNQDQMGVSNADSASTLTNYGVTQTTATQWTQGAALGPL